LNNDRIWTKDFTLLMISLLLISSANYFFAPVMAIYAGLISHSAAYASIITASFYLGSVGMRLINGTLVQKYGAHRLMLLSAGLGLIACFAHNFAGVIALLVIFRILHGISYSIFSTASGTAASFMVPKGRLGEGMGYYTIGNVLAMALGPAFATMILTDNTLIQFHQLFFTAAAICTVAFVLVCFIKTDDAKNFSLDMKKAAASAASLPRTFLGFEKGVILPTLISFLMSFAYSPVIIYVTVYGEGRGWKNMGFAFTAYALGLLASRLFTGRVSDRLGADTIMFPAYLCGALALTLIAFSPSARILYLAMVILGLCVGAYNPQINVFCISRCSDARRGTATAAFNGACDLGLAFGSAVGGLLIDHFGYSSTFLGGAALCLITMVIYFLTLSHFSIHPSQKRVG